ncbi:MAG: hypothetical protein RJA70_1601 [Pseudomonadota bacterium]|jgi:acyl dehydratase
MSLDPNSVGSTTRVHRLSYDWQTLALYALGIGAKKDELDYLYEKRGPKVYPSFAVVPTYPVLAELLELSRGPYERVVHGGQSIRVHGPIPPAAELETQGRIVAMYDLKRMAQVILRTESTVSGKLLFETEWQIIFRGEGGFGGDKRPRPDAPVTPKRDADWVFEELISPEQALLYRLSGDHNPLHADPDFAASVGFEQGPILHGLATFGYLCRAATLRSCGGDASRITSLTAQFKKPVWPGESLRVEGFNTPEGQVIMQAYAGGRSEPVVGGCAAELAPLES